MFNRQSIRSKIHQQSWLLTILWFSLILLFSLIPAGDQVFNEMPVEGDNFKAPNHPTIYHYQHSAKYSYDDSTCYFSKGNPPFGTSYEQGGIKTINKEIVESIPNKGSVCEEKIVQAPKPKTSTGFSLKVFIRKFADYGHYPAYVILTLLLLWSFDNVALRITWSLTLSITGGILIEIIQGLFIDGRSGSLSDLMLNLLGIGTAFVFIKLKPRILSKKAA